MTDEHRHNQPDCEGGFRPVNNDPSSGGPDALVCPGCGAWRPISDLGEEPKGPGVIADA